MARINDDVTLSTDELLALPEEEVFTMITMVGGAFAAPGTTGNTVMDLTPGRYVAVCPIPQGMTPEIAAQIRGSGGGSAPAGSAPTARPRRIGREDRRRRALITRHGGGHQAGDGTEPAGSAPSQGSAPGGPEQGPPHFVLGMVQEFTVV